MFELNDYAWWCGSKVEITKLWGCSVIDGVQVVTIKISDYFSTTIKVNQLKNIVRLSAIIGEKI